MHITIDPLIHARALRNDILSAPSVWLPRRDVLLEWLNGFVRRAEVPSYGLAETEISDLQALDAFLRTREIASTQT
jgi:hypothetical protein